MTRVETKSFDIQLIIIIHLKIQLIQPMNFENSLSKCNFKTKLAFQESLLT